MEESKICAMDRLRREGRWEEASLFRDEERRRLRDEGLPKAEANDRSWAAMMEKYPPIEAAPTGAADVASVATADGDDDDEDDQPATFWMWCDASSRFDSVLKKWLSDLGVAVTDAARSEARVALLETAFDGMVAYGLLKLEDFKPLIE
jgi:hypothetical protein